MVRGWRLQSQRIDHHRWWDWWCRNHQAWHRRDFRGEEGQEELDKLDMAIYIKDKYNITGNAYHEMAQLFKEMPRHYKIKDRIKELNKAWNIKPTPEGTCGVQQSLEKHLKVHLKHMVTAMCQPYNTCSTWFWMWM